MSIVMDNRNASSEAIFNVISIIDSYADLNIKCNYFKKNFDEFTKRTEDHNNKYLELDKKNRLASAAELHTFQLLRDFIHTEYVKAIENLTLAEIKETIDIIVNEKTRLESKIKDLLERKAWVNSKQEEFYANHNYDEEKEYIRMIQIIDEELNRIQMKPGQFEAFIYSLSAYAEKKSSEQSKTI